MNFHWIDDWKCASRGEKSPWLFLKNPPAAGKFCTDLKKADHRFMLASFFERRRKKCEERGREKEKLRRNKASPVGKYAWNSGEAARTKLIRWIVRSLRPRQRSWHIAMHKNPSASSRKLENQVFFFTFRFSAAIFTRLDVRSFHLIIRLFFRSHFTFFARDFRYLSLTEVGRRVDGREEWVNLGTYSLLSSLRSGADWPVVCSVQRKKSFWGARSLWSVPGLSLSSPRLFH